VSCSRASPYATAALAALALALASVVPAPAAAKPHTPPKRKLCVDRVTVRDAPFGYAVAYLHRPQKLSVYGRPVDRWVLIRARGDVTGWIPAKALCKRGR
jgi:hypothetical protein